MSVISITKGRIGRDAERKAVGDFSVVEFSVAENWKRGKQEGTNWFRVSVWGNYGESLIAHLKKGQPISLTGELRVREYEDRDGNSRTSVEVHANEISVPYLEDAEPSQHERAKASGYQSDDDIPF